MTRVVVTFAAFLLLASVAWAAEIEGTVRSWDPEANKLTLGDGTELVVAGDAKVRGDQLKVGAFVKASYEEESGKKLVTFIEVKGN
jgi:hypothetical protein